MLDIKWIRENQDALARALANRGWLPDKALLEKLREGWPNAVSEIEAVTAAEEKQSRTIAALLQIDFERRELIKLVEGSQQVRNKLSREIGNAKAAGDQATVDQLMAEIAERRKTEEAPRQIEAVLNEALAYIPNVPLDDVPVGPTEEFNVEYRQGRGKAPTVATPKQHYELGEAMGQMDFATAAKLSGTRFTVLKAGLARMERALGQFMLDLHTQPEKDGLFGYTEIAPPLLVKDEAAFGTAQLPKFESDLFATAGEMRFWLIPTAEVPLTNLVRESIANESDLPLRYTALTPCFRSEAGAAGRDTRGMLRQHQFDKVELVSITTPEQSRDEHERMLSCAEEVLKRLGIHYRVMVLSTGDMGFAAQKTYDIEVWLPGQGTYREISSCSVCGDFQARRMQARYRPKDAKGNRLVHTLNGSGVAVGRALIAVMENYQNEDGSITVPDVLRPYMNGMERVA